MLVPAVSPHRASSASVFTRGSRRAPARWPTAFAISSLSPRISNRYTLSIRITCNPLKTKDGDSLYPIHRGANELRDSRPTFRPRLRADVEEELAGGGAGFEQAMRLGDLFEREGAEDANLQPAFADAS